MSCRHTIDSNGAYFDNHNSRAIAFASMPITPKEENNNNSTAFIPVLATPTSILHTTYLVH